MPRREIFACLALVLSVLVVPNGVRAAAEGSADIALNPSDPTVVPLILQTLVENPSIRIRSVDHQEFTLPLEVSSVWFSDESGNTTFVDDLSSGLLSHPREWTAVLRGALPQLGATGALVLKSSGLQGAFNLPDGRSLLTGKHEVARWSFRNQNTIGGSAPQLYVTDLSGGSSAPSVSELIPPPDPPESPSSAHSMAMSKHIWKPTENSMTFPLDPVNVVFYQNPYVAVFSWGMLQNHGWIEGVCGSTEYLYIYDARHGGTDGWKAQRDNYGKEDSVCIDERYHARSYLSSTGDSHTPGFQDYIPLPAHWECDWHSFDCVNPQRGQDQLLGDIIGDYRVRTFWTWQLADNKDCRTCERWNGWIDMYRLSEVSSTDPCGGNKPQIFQTSVTVSWSTYQYKTLEWRCVTGGGGGGGSPYYAAWDGEKFVPENNILPGGENRSGDVTDYFLPATTPVGVKKTYAVQVQEFEGEHTYLDYVKMYGVAYRGAAELVADSYGNILSLTDPQGPITAIDSQGRDVRQFLLKRNDGLFLEGAAGYWVDLKFRPAAVSIAKLVMNLDALKTSMHVQVQDPNGSWSLVDIKHPRVRWALEVTNLTRFLSWMGKDLTVRLYWTDVHKLDWAALDASPDERLSLVELRLVSAVHSGFGDVMESLSANDGIYAETLPGQTITLTFGADTSAGYSRIIFVIIGRVEKVTG